MALFTFQTHPACARDMQARKSVSGHHGHLRGLSEVELLAHLIWYEARGENVRGKLAVAHVVMNRVKARPHYGGTISEVILKPGQFSCFNGNDGDPYKVLRPSANDREFALSKAIAELASRGHLKSDPTSGATRFHRVDCKPPRVPVCHQGQPGRHLPERLQHISRNR